MDLGELNRIKKIMVFEIETRHTNRTTISMERSGLVRDTRGHAQKYAIKIMQINDGAEDPAIRNRLIWMNI